MIEFIHDSVSSAEQDSLKAVDLTKAWILQGNQPPSLINPGSFPWRGYTFLLQPQRQAFLLGRGTLGVRATLSCAAFPLEGILDLEGRGGTVPPHHLCYRILTSLVTD